MCENIDKQFMILSLNTILTQLQKDIDLNYQKHQYQLESYREILRSKDILIQELQNQLKSYRMKSKGKTNSNSKMKKVIINKCISSFDSEKVLGDVTQNKMSLSIQMDTKGNKYPVKPSLITKRNRKQNVTQLPKRLKSPDLKSNNYNSEKNSLQISLSTQNIGKQNSKVDDSVKFPFASPTNRCVFKKQFSSAKPSVPQNKFSKKSKISDKKSFSRDKDGIQKKCINIVIPKINFCAYSVNSK